VCPALLLARLSFNKTNGIIPGDGSRYCARECKKRDTCTVSYAPMHTRTHTHTHTRAQAQCNQYSLPQNFEIAAVTAKPDYTLAALHANLATCGMDVWVYECKGVCAYACMGVWAYVWTCGCMGVWVYECMGVWVHSLWMYGTDNLTPTRNR